MTIFETFRPYRMQIQRIHGMVGTTKTYLPRVRYQGILRVYVKTLNNDKIENMKNQRRRLGGIKIKEK